MNKNTSTIARYAVADTEPVKQKVLNWAQQFGTFCFLDNHQYNGAHHTAECLLGAGVKRWVKAAAGNALDQLEALLGDKGQGEEQPGPWLFGHLGYDLKKETAGLSSALPDHIGFDDLFFFEPEVVIRLTGTELIIEAAKPGKVLQELMESTDEPVQAAHPLDLRSRFSRDEYLEVVEQLRQHILRGDCYEINFCQEFFSENASIHPLEVYRKLSGLSPNPFSALYRVQDQWLICASPERFIRKQGNRILSQPIKGTSGRDTRDAVTDTRRREGLYQSAKDRAENVMIVDLVRNDLSRICSMGSVQVDELFGIYSFPQVHQMISTVSGQLKPGISFREIIRALFPMGSMTGAPKKRVMELIEKYERTRRGIFSGAVGYITPEGDFDFNVVIRSILYNARDRYVSFLAGSGITFYSQAEEEWEECRLKAHALRLALEP